MLKVLLKLQDWLSWALFVLASVSLVAATLLFLFEVASRYIFNAPTAWSSEYVQYCLTAIVFAALPEITKRHAHIVIDIVTEYLNNKAAFWLGRVNLLISIVVSSTAAWIMAGEAWKQFERGLMTNAAFPIPRYPLTALLAIGLFGAASYFLRHLFEAEEQK